MVFLNKHFMNIWRDSDSCLSGKAICKCQLGLVCWLAMFTSNVSLILSEFLLLALQITEQKGNEFAYFSAYCLFLSNEFAAFSHTS